MLETLRQSPSVRAFVLRTLAPIYAEQGRYDDAGALADVGRLLRPRGFLVVTVPALPVSGARKTR
jgi:hypothetical protein